MESLGCSAKVRSGYAWERYQCSKPATVTCEGKLWCKIHDPERVAARKQKREQQESKDNTELERRFFRAMGQIAELGIGRPDGFQYDIKHPITGIKLSFEEVEELLARLRQGGSK